MNYNYKTIEQIEINNGIVYTRSYLSGTSSTPTTAFRAVCEDVELTKILQEEGRHAVLKEIGRGIFERKIRMRPYDCRLAEHIQQAGTLLRAPLTLSLDADTAGEFIATVTEGYEKSASYSPFSELSRLEALRSDPEWVFSICKNNPAAFHFADESVRRNRSFARRYIHEFILEDGFAFPTYFRTDKSLALEALQKNASVFLFLDISLRNDKEIVQLAYDPNTPRRKIDFFASYIGPSLRADAVFMRSLLRKCPALRIDGCTDIYRLPGAAEMWAAQNDWVETEFTNLPLDILLRPTVRNMLTKRFRDDKSLLAILDKLITTGLRAALPNDTCCSAANLPSRRVARKDA